MITDVGIVGGGKAGREIFDVLRRSSVTRVNYVCDKNLDAPAMQDAKQYSVKTLTSLDEALAHKVNWVIDVTGNAQVFNQISKALENSETKLIHADTAYFFFNVIDHLDEDDQEDSMKERYLSFHLAEEDYAISIASVIEIVGIPKITFLPDMPHYIKGVVNMRGTVFPVMDLRLKFGFPEKEYGDRTCVVVVHHGDKTFGLIVDFVNETLEIPDANIEPPPRFAQQDHSHHRFLRGIGKVGDQVKIVVDVEALLAEEDVVVN